MAEVINFKKEDGENTVLNKVKWALFFAVFFVALYANYEYLAGFSAWIRLGVWVLVTLVLALLFWWTSQGKSFINFSKAARNEMRKVVWPTRQETIQSTLAVVVLVSILAVLLWVIDSFWLWLITLITG